MNGNVDLFNYAQRGNSFNKSDVFRLPIRIILILNRGCWRFMIAAAEADTHSTNLKCRRVKRKISHAKMVLAHGASFNIRSV